MNPTVTSIVRSVQPAPRVHPWIARQSGAVVGMQSSAQDDSIFMLTTLGAAGVGAYFGYQYGAHRHFKGVSSGLASIVGAATGFVMGGFVGAFICFTLIFPIIYSRSSSSAS